MGNLHVEKNEEITHWHPGHNQIEIKKRMNSIAWKLIAKMLLGYDVVSDWIISIKFNGQSFNIMFIQFCALTTRAEEGFTLKFSLKSKEKQAKYIAYDWRLES